MKTQVMMQLPSPAQNDTLLLLGRHGAEPHRKYKNTWYFFEASVPEEIEEHLRMKGVDFSVFFEFKPTAVDGPDELAAYLLLGRFEDLRNEDSSLLLARNVGLQDVIASAGLARELSEISPQIAWGHLEGDRDFLILEHVPRLPDPVMVPHAVFLSEGEDGIWAVQSDGRELLTRKNYEFLMQSGIANPYYCRIGGRVLRWRRGLVFGGRVLEFLTGQGVIGVPALPSFLEKIEAPS